MKDKTNSELSRVVTFDTLDNVIKSGNAPSEILSSIIENLLLDGVTQQELLRHLDTLYFSDNCSLLDIRLAEYFVPKLAEVVALRDNHFLNRLVTSLFIQTLDFHGECDVSCIKCVDFIFFTIDELLVLKKFTIVDSILKDLDVTKYSVDTTLAVLSITFAAKHKLKNYKEFYDRCSEHYNKVLDVTQSVSDLLKGLS